MRTWSRLPLAATIVLVLAIGVVGLRMTALADDTGDRIRRADALAQERTIARLVDQYLGTVAKEAAEFAAAADFTLRPGDPADRVRLEEFVTRSSLFDHGAALVDPARRPLNAYAAGALPPADDPGYAGVVHGLLAGQPGVSSVMTADGTPVVAVGVPVRDGDAVRAVLLGYWRPADSDLQKYTENARVGKAFVVDSTGTIVTAPDRALVGTRFPHRPVLDSLAGREGGVFDMPAISGGLTATHAPVELGRWGLVRLMSTDELLGEIRDGHRRVNLALLGLLAVATASVAVLNSRAERIRRRGESRFRSLVQNASDIVSVVDPAGRVTYASPALERVLGYRAGGPEVGDVFALLDPSRAELARATLRHVAENPGELVRTEAEIRRRDGSFVWFEVTLDNLLGCDGVDGIVVNMRDISERKHFEEKLAHQAFHDALTGLPNRLLFQDLLREALAEGDASPGAAVLFVDLDRFKVVNDSLGHEAGDQLLVSVSRRLRACLPDEATLARLSGDEFAVLLAGASDVAAAQVAGELIDALRTPIGVAGREVFVGASVGIALGQPGDHPDDVVRDADVAMYRAKERGRLRFELFAPDLGVQARRRLDVEAELRQAVERGELVPWYQPEIDLRTGDVVGVEALLRWIHPTRGVVAPAQFIPLAEETGLIVAIGAAVLETACRQVMQWRRDDVAGPDLRLSVNLSGRQLERGDDLVAAVAGVLQRTGMPPVALNLELTETVLMEGDHVRDTLRKLRGLGVGVAIDDFGTGYSSLSYLRDLPVSVLKLDRSFVVGLDDDAADAAIAGAVVSLAHSLGLSVTAEGVELGGQRSRLSQMGCDRAQGFLFSRPVPAEEVPALLRSPKAQVRAEP